MSTTSEPFEIETPDGWVVYPRLNRLSGPGGELQLEPRVMRLLLCLVAAGEEPVSRDELLEAVWGEDTFVAEGSLTLAVSELRRILGDDATSPRYVETIRKVGYRWLPAIRPVEEVPARGESLETAPAEPPQTLSGRRSSGRWARALPILVGGLVLALVVGWWSTTRDRSEVPAAPVPTPSLVPVTTYPGMEVTPDLSPDGQQVAFAHWQLPERRFRIRLKQRATETAVDLPGEPDFESSPAWSPDGGSLAFLRCDDGDCGVFVQAWPGGDPGRVVGVRSVSSGALDWLPDGETLVFADRRDPYGVFRLYRVGLLGGHVEVLAPDSDPAVEDLYPRVSPRGDRIAFVRGDLEAGSERGLFGVVGHVVTMSLDGSDLEVLTPEVEEVFGLAWLPGGIGVIYAARTQGGRWELRRRDLGAEEATSRVVLRSEAVVRNPVVGSDGEVVFERWSGDRDLWRVDLATGETARLLESTQPDSEPVPSRDGSKIAFVSYRSGAEEVWFADRETGALHKLTDLGGPAVLTPRWAPDGRSLAFVAREEGSSVLYRVAVEPPAPPHRILAWPGSALVSSWSEDGRAVYVGATRSGRWQVWRVDARSGAAERVVPGDAITAFELPATADGGIRLLFTRPHEDGIWQTDVAEGRASPVRLVLPDLRSFDRSNWGVTENGVYYAVREPGSLAITVHLWDPESAADTVLVALPWLSPNAKAVSVASDGSEVFYSRLEGLDADLVSVRLEL